MRIKWFPIKCTVFVLLLIQFVLFSHLERKAVAFTNQVIQQGATWEDVVELQSRLQYIGFYNGKIDGVFDWKTYWALRNFQYEFGLPIDGLAGAKTKAKLVRASKYDKRFVNKQIDKGHKFTHYGGVDLNKQTTPAKPKTPTKPKVAANPKAKQSPTKTQPKAKQPVKQQAQTPAKNQIKAKQPVKQKAQTPAKQIAKAPAASKPKVQSKPKAQQNKQPAKATAANTPNGFSQNDIKLLSNAVYGESRGEPYIGQVAVAAVILNRINSASFPNTVSGVIFEPGAFTAVADGQIWLTPNENAKKAVLDAINGYDPTGEAIYYFNPDTATNGWIWSRPQIKKIGKHIFCK
ncbi:spore cortex-lytic enzyme [Bacillus sp. T3]|uniref:spore cortex-lytic enzyme n=1 Tax=Bacillus sp. T3 TaxID=467262 RepID=UPI002982862F|nr:spore cortex-lytic enzyme [Bacillus sp. T3]